MGRFINRSKAAPQLLTPHSSLLTFGNILHPPSYFLLSPSSFLLTFLERAPAAAEEAYREMSGAGHPLRQAAASRKSAYPRSKMPPFRFLSPFLPAPPAISAESSHFRSAPPLAAPRTAALLSRSEPHPPCRAAPEPAV